MEEAVKRPGQFVTGESMDYLFLADRPDAIPTIARWYFDEWGRKVPGEAEDGTQLRLESYLNTDRMPLMVLAVDGEEIAGVAQLKYREMEIYPDKEHWLGGVYVSSRYRGQGVASRLVENIAGIATSFGIAFLHLQTERLDGGLYGRLGWKAVQRVCYKGNNVVVMERSLGLGALVK